MYYVDLLIERLSFEEEVWAADGLACLSLVESWAAIVVGVELLLKQIRTLYG